MPSSTIASGVLPYSFVSKTRIWLRVSVPVLSVQMTVIAPIVSLACILRTRLFVRSIRRMLTASDSVTLIGSPSGTATTISVTATMKYCNTSVAIVSQSERSRSPMIMPLTSSATNVTIASDIPTRPISFDNFCNCRFSGVCSSLSTVACSATWPNSVASPTAVTVIVPCPAFPVVPRSA